MAKLRPSAMLSDFSGRLAGDIVVNSPSGLVLRRQQVFRRPTSPGQAAAAKRMSQASKLWLQLSEAQVEAWDRFAHRITRTGRVSNEHYHPTGFNMFVALSVKLWQIDPEQAVPLTPPTSAFLGDDILVSAAPDPGVLVSPFANYQLVESSGTTDEDTHIIFAASGPNLENVTTELFLQRLAHPNRKPGVQFKSVGFHTFTPDAPSIAVAVEPGTYVPAYQFVNTETGQITLQQTLAKLITGELVVRKDGCCPSCGHALRS